MKSKCRLHCVHVREKNVMIQRHVFVRWQHTMRLIFWLELWQLYGLGKLKMKLYRVFLTDTRDCVYLLTIWLFLAKPMGHFCYIVFVCKIPFFSTIFPYRQFFFSFNCTSALAYTHNADNEFEVSFQFNRLFNKHENQKKKKNWQQDNLFIQ